jgi:hypothetical protein
VKNGERYPHYVNVAGCQAVLLIILIVAIVARRKRVELRMWIITRIVSKGAVYSMLTVRARLNRISNAQGYTKQRIYNYFNTNEKIIQSKFNEDEWNAYFETVIKPVSVHLSNLKQMYISGVMDLANDLKIHGYSLDLEKIRKTAGKRFERDYSKNINERRKKHENTIKD